METLGLLNVTLTEPESESEGEGEGEGEVGEGWTSSPKSTFSCLLRGASFPEYNLRAGCGIIFFVCLSIDVLCPERESASCEKSSVHVSDEVLVEQNCL